MIKEFAAALREEMGIVGRFDFDAVLPALGLSVKQVNADGFEGALIRSTSGMRGSILIKQSIRENTRKRFTIAHEIGHYALHQEQNRVSCGASDIEQWQEGDHNPEREADEFASELLLPTPEMTRQMGAQWPSFAVIESCAQTFDVSLMATARKYCDLAVQSCAIVWSEGGVIRWFHPSGNFTYWVRVGQELGEESLASKLLLRVSNRSDLEDVPAAEWISSSWLREGAELKEQTIAMPSYNGCLSLLWANRKIEDKPSSDDSLLEELDPNRFDSSQRKTWPGKR